MTGTIDPGEGMTAGAARGRVDLDAARSAVRALTPRMAGLLRATPDASAPSVGSWTIGDVAAHLAHVAGLDLASALGGQGPEKALADAGIAAPATIGVLGGMTAALLGADPVRDLVTQAERLEHDVQALLTACEGGEQLVPWLLGISLPRSAVCSHQLYEMLIHGWDITKAAGAEWQIDEEHARLALEGFVLAAVHGLGPGDVQGRDVIGSCEVSLRGGGRFALALTEAGPVVDASLERVDLRVEADPSALLLAISGRCGDPRSSAAAGKVDASGPRPDRGWLALRVITAP